MPTGATNTQANAIKATTSTLGAVSVGNIENEEFRQITGVAAGTQDSDAVNIAQLKAASSAAVTQGMNFSGQGGKDVHRDLGQTLKVVGADDNIATVANGADTLKIALSKSLDLSSVKTGGTLMNKDGVKIKGAADQLDVVLGNTGLAIGSNVSLGSNGLTVHNVVINDQGINAGGQQITGVAMGKADSDAVNVAQLKAVSATAGAWADTPLIFAGTTGSTERKPGEKLKIVGADKMVSTHAENGELKIDLPYLKVSPAGMPSPASATNGALAIGSRTVASGHQSIAIGSGGSGATAIGQYSVAIGADASILNSNGASVAIGYGAHVSGKDASGGMAIGYKTKADNSGMALGSSAAAGGSYSTAVGYLADTLGELSAALGTSATAEGKYSTAIGAYSKASGEQSTALGLTATATEKDALALGLGAKASSSGGVALGAFSVADTKGGVAGFVPMGASATQTDAINATISTRGAVSVGNVANKEFRQITGVAAGTEDSDAVNIAQLKAAGSAAATQGMNFAGQSGTDVHRDLGQTLKVAGADKNIATEADGADTLKIALNKDLDLSSVKAGDTLMNNDGVKIKGAADQLDVVLGNTGLAIGSHVSLGSNGLTVHKVVINDQGISAGDQKITNVLAGTAMTDAVNLAQLDALQMVTEAGQTHYFSVNDKGASKEKGASKPGNYNNDGATGARSLAIVANAVASGSGGVAVGSAAKSLADHAVAIGDGSQAYGTSGVSLGYLAGSGSSLGGKNNYTGMVFIGQSAGFHSIGFWNTFMGPQSAGADSTGHSNVAIGQASFSNGQGNQNSMVGPYAGGNSMGSMNVAQGKYAGAYSTGDNNIAIGTEAGRGADGARVTGSNNVAIGAQANSAVSVESATVLGAYSNATKEASVALGAYSTASVEGGVALGSGSVANTGAGAVGFVPTGASATQADAIKATTSTRGAVSVGDVTNKEFRQITSVAAGTQDSDAVNVAQLKATGSAVAIQGMNFAGQSGTDVHRDLGQTLMVVGADGNLTTEANGADTLKLVLNKDIDLSSVSTDDTVMNNAGVTIKGAAGRPNVELNNTGLIIGGGPSVTIDGINAGGQKITNVAIGEADTDAVNFGQLDELSKTVDNVSKTANAGWKLTVQGANESKVAPDAAVDLASSDNSILISKGADDTHVDFKLNKDLKVASDLDVGKDLNVGGNVEVAGGTTLSGGATIDDHLTVLPKTTIDMGGNQVHNVADGELATDAVNLKQLNEVKDTPLIFAADKGEAQDRKLGETVAINGDEKNISTTTKDGGVKIALNKDLDLGADGSVSTGDTLVSDKGVTVGADVVLGSMGLNVGSNISLGNTGLRVHKVVINDKGINAGEQKITNVKDGSEPTDAVNFSQLKAISDTADAFSDTPLIFAGTTGSIKRKLGETLKIVGADTMVSTQAENGELKINLPYFKLALAGGKPSAASAASGSLAIGNGTVATGHQSIAMGSGGTGAKATSQYSIAVGAGASVTSEVSGVAIGYNAVVSGGTKLDLYDGTAVGHIAKATSSNATALGSRAMAVADDVTAIGAGAIGSGVQSTALGVGTRASSSGGVALGEHSVAATEAGIVGFIPDGASAAQNDAIKATKGTQGAVSVGDVANQKFRQITSVAAGTEDSDAVNVAQLKAAGSAATAQGVNFSGQSGKDVHRDLGQTLKVAGADENITTEADGADTLKIALNKDLDLGADGSVSTGDTLVSNKGVTVGPDVVLGSTGLNIGSNISLGNTGLRVHKVVINEQGINAGGQKITNVAIGEADTDAVNFGQLNELSKTVDNVSKTANAGWKLTAQGANESKVAPDATVDLASSDDSILITKGVDDAHVDFKLNKDLKVASDLDVGKDLNVGGNVEVAGGTTLTGGATIGDHLTVLPNTTIDMGGNQVHNVEDGELATDAVNLKQLNEVKETPLTFVADKGEALGRKLGEKVAINGDGKNISTATTADGVKIELASNLDLGADGSVRTGDTVLNHAGVTIKGATDQPDVVLNNTGLSIAGDGPSVTIAGINAGGQQITNLAAGTKPDDAVNFGQLTELKDHVVRYADSPDGSKSYLVLEGAAPNDVQNGGTTISNLAQGDISDSSTEAVNGAQLYDQGEQVASALGGNSRYEKDHLVTSLVVDNTAYDSVHKALNGVSSDLSKQIADVAQTANAGWQIEANSTGVSQVKPGGKVEFVDGDNVQIRQIVGRDTNTVVVGLAQDIKVNSVNADKLQAKEIAIEDGPIANQDGIDMVGKKIIKLNAGTESTDAVNLGQLQAVTGNLQGQVNQLQGRVQQLDNKLSAGVAAAMATAGLPQAYLPGKSMFAIAGGAYNGESGFAMGLSTVSDNGSWVMKISGNSNSRGDYGGAVGVGYQW